MKRKTSANASIGSKEYERFKRRAEYFFLFFKANFNAFFSTFPRSDF